MTYMDFDPNLIRQRNEQMLREVHSLRLEERLRANHEPRSLQLIALVQSGVQPLLRTVGLAR
jgi:hypothetical protein